MLKVQGSQVEGLEIKRLGHYLCCVQGSLERCLWKTLRQGERKFLKATLTMNGGDANFKKLGP